LIELIVLDVDGCMTDGKISYTADGKEIKSFNVKDGLAINSWNRLGMKSVIITGRESDIVSKRADELGVQFVFQGVKNKKKVLKDILFDNNISLDEVAVIGDDMNDLSMIGLSKLSFCPNDASEFVKNEVTYVLQNSGGNGAIREMIEKLLVLDDKMVDFIELWH
jgi:3-deoxy-D-manno-octulosonate 8-phosphate phosphatase (KDO 8-P phosphatase)